MIGKERCGVHRILTLAFTLSQSPSRQPAGEAVVVDSRKRDLEWVHVRALFRICMSDLEELTACLTGCEGVASLLGR